MAVVKFGGEKRGCGYPQVNGLYLVSAGVPVVCDRLPFTIPVCPTCGETIRFSGGIQKLNALKLFGEHKDCKDPKSLRPCPACQPSEDPAALMWVGDKYYSPESFNKEAIEMGVSKRINALPNFFKVGKTWLFLAHKKAVREFSEEKKKLVQKPGIIMLCRPNKLLKVMTESAITEEKVREYEEQGIDIMSVPDNDERFTKPLKSSKPKKFGLDAIIEN